MKIPTLLCALLVPLAPCLWDSDTLDTELRGLPDAFDLVVGRWHRHGDAYYRDRVNRLGGKAELTLDEFDDLAVAHERLGDGAAAIATLERKAAALAKAPNPDHRYRLLANLGTFHAHAGRYDAALAALKEAVALNPNAHFGREIWQIEAIEFVAAAQRKPALWQESGLVSRTLPGLRGLFRWHREPTEVDDGHQPPSLPPTASAYQGIAGMVRFGQRDSALLFHALAEVFLDEQHLNLGWWARRRAIEAGHPASDRLQESLRSIENHWIEAANYTNDRNAIPDEALYTAVRENADRWLATFQRLEAEALARGDDVRSDAAVAALVAAADQAVPRIPIPTAWGRLQWIIALTVSAAIAAVLAKLWQRRRSRAHTA